MYGPLLHSLLKRVKINISVFSSTASATLSPLNPYKVNSILKRASSGQTQRMERAVRLLETSSRASRPTSALDNGLRSRRSTIPPRSRRSARRTLTCSRSVSRRWCFMMYRPRGARRRRGLLITRSRRIRGWGLLMLSTIRVILRSVSCLYSGP